ncbi:hypothetical protein [Luoshenia tenuis]|jgi:hypothetical protein|uniref:hypothetical protein n=1 Tax=Luoshenia tenuis TaxID=2763654 RepID=UPI003D935612
MNPFELKPRSLESCIRDWNGMYPKPYDKRQTDPYTKTRIILMNGTEFEAVYFSHNFSRKCPNNDLRRELALLRRIEQQQQKTISMLKPADETILEQTIGYEQLAVDLTARMAQCEKDKNVRAALDFALLEDFDHLYRYADLMDMETGEKAENLVGRYTEIMPGRPTIAHHRHPYDEIKPYIHDATADPLTKLHASIITAAEQQTMNYYMNVGCFYPTEMGRKLYMEIGLVEEQHVSQYGSLIDTTTTLLECLVMHEYTECYLYYSCYQDETDPAVKAIWEQFFEMEVAHLHKAAELLAKYENKEACQLIPQGEFPELLSLGSNINYVRHVLSTVNMTADKEGYCPVDKLPSNSDFMRYQQLMNENVADVPSHQVIEQYIALKGEDYRFETAPNPIDALQDRTQDNTTVGRK